MCRSSCVVSPHGGRQSLKRGSALLSAKNKNAARRERTPRPPCSLFSTPPPSLYRLSLEGSGRPATCVGARNLTAQKPRSDQRAHRFRAEVESIASAVTPLSTQAATEAIYVRRISRDTISACRACSAAEAPTGAAAYAAGAAAAAAGALGTARLCNAASTPASISAFISDAKVS